MKFSFRSQDLLRTVQATTLVAGLFYAGCKDANPRTSDPVTESPPQPKAEETAPVSEPTREPVSPKTAPAPRREVAESPAPSDPAALAKQFRETTDPDKRGELVEALWSLDTAAAVDTLRQLFITEREPDVKIDMIAGLSDSKKPETREARFGLVVMALSQGQPKDIRELAAQMLVDFDDPRAVGLLQQFSQDADPDMREAAKEALETRRAAEQP